MMITTSAAYFGGKFSNMRSQFLRYFLPSPKEMLKKQIESSDSGFTMLEILVVLVIVGVLAAIAGPTWLSFVNRQKLNSVQNQVFSAFRTTQSNARRDKVSWQTSLRVATDGNLEMAIHKATQPDNFPWVKLGSDVTIRTTDSCPASPVPKSCTTMTTNILDGISAYTVRFDGKGLPDRGVNDQGQITFSLSLLVNEPQSPRTCVVVSTLLGAMRTAEGQGCNRS